MLKNSWPKSKIQADELRAGFLTQLTNSLCDAGGFSAQLHRHERAFAQRAEPGFLAASELASASFDAIDAGSKGVGSRESGGGAGQTINYFSITHSLQC